MLLSAVGLYKTYRKYTIQTEVLRGLDLEVHEGEFLSVVGASGSGKSTLLHLLGILDRPDKGEIYLDDKRIDNLPAKRRDQLRNQTFGFIFQFYHLLPELTALENVLMPQMIAHSVLVVAGGRRRELRNRAVELLDRVGLGHRLHHRPRELSGGEMQRAAVARALINRPRVLLRRRADRQPRRRERRRRRRPPPRLEPPREADYHHGYAQHGHRRRHGSRGSARPGRVEAGAEPPNYADRVLAPTPVGGQ